MAGAKTAVQKPAEGKNIWMVEKGDSLWSIAEKSVTRRAPTGYVPTNAEVSAEMERIVSLNIPKFKQGKNLIFEGLRLDLGGTPTPEQAVASGKNVKAAREANARDNGASPGLTARQSERLTYQPKKEEPAYPSMPQYPLPPKTGQELASSIKFNWRDMLANMGPGRGNFGKYVKSVDSS